VGRNAKLEVASGFLIFCGPGSAARARFGLCEQRKCPAADLSSVSHCIAGKFGVDVKAKSGGFQVKAGQGRLEKPRADDVALFLHTSGTTSRPKVTKPD